MSVGAAVVGAAAAAVVVGAAAAVVEVAAGGVGEGVGLQEGEAMVGVAAVAAAHGMR